ncbi:MAG: hypothetical protein LDL33_05305 [Desulfomonile sp.]|nr:hypothetical protein [Desulfomonile sp.]
MERKTVCRDFGGMFIVFLTASLVVLTGLAELSVAQALPSDLFSKAAPGGAVGVGEARKSAVVGKTIVLQGVIGGMAASFSDKLAVFLLADKSLAACSDGCGKDFCGVPRDKLIANLAMIQVVDGTGKPLKATLHGVNGLKPSAEVTVKGIVAKQDNNVLIVNARNIFVNR